MVLLKSDSLDIALLWESFKIFLKFLIRQYRLPETSILFPKSPNN